MLLSTPSFRKGPALSCQCGIKRRDMKRFDARFGADFLASVPLSPGVYRLYDQNGELIYVGKAKSLRRRLSQYRNARRSKRGKKMRSLVAEAASIRWETCDSEIEALLLEIALIQRHRPRWNVAGSFSFLYPMIGMRAEPPLLKFCFTTVPHRFSGYRFHGAFRSRETTGEGFFALMRLLKHLGHRASARELRGERAEEYSYVFGFRRLPDWGDLWDRFFRGDSLAAIETLTLGLLEKSGARARAAEVQEGIEALKRFWTEEAVPLAQAIRTTGFPEYPVPQTERDPLFLRFRSFAIAAEPALSSRGGGSADNAGLGARGRSA